MRIISYLSSATFLTFEFNKADGVFFDFFQVPTYKEINLKVIGKINIECFIFYCLSLLSVHINLNTVIYVSITFYFGDYKFISQYNKYYTNNYNFST